MAYLELTPMQIDALKEVSNIGAGNAATALSQLINSKIDMTVPSVNIISTNKLLTDINSEKSVVGVIVRVVGDTPGNILVIFEKETADEFIKTLTQSNVDITSEMGSSVLCEIGNIISGTYMNAIAQFTNLFLAPSVPAVCYDMYGAILSTTFVESEQYDDYVLDIETVFLKDNNSINGNFYYIPRPGSLEKILNSLGVK